MRFLFFFIQFIYLYNNLSALIEEGQMSLTFPKSVKFHASFYSN